MKNCLPRYLECSNCSKRFSYVMYTMYFNIESLVVYRHLIPSKFWEGAHLSHVWTQYKSFLFDEGIIDCDKITINLVMSLFGKGFGR